MCMGLPMQVQDAGDAWADVVRQGQLRRVRTALVGPLSAGDWVLVHIDSAIERLSPERAAEVDAALALVNAVMSGEAPNTDNDPFSLPSAMSAADLARLTGQR